MTSGFGGAEGTRTPDLLFASKAGPTSPGLSKKLGETPSDPVVRRRRRCFDDYRIANELGGSRSSSNQKWRICGDQAAQPAASSAGAVPARSGAQSAEQVVTPLRMSVQGLVLSLPHVAGRTDMNGKVDCLGHLVQQSVMDIGCDVVGFFEARG